MAPPLAREGEEKSEKSSHANLAEDNYHNHGSIFAINPRQLPFVARIRARPVKTMMRHSSQEEKERARRADYLIRRKRRSRSLSRL